MIGNREYIRHVTPAKTRIEKAVLLCGNFHMSDWMPLNGHPQSSVPVLGFPLFWHAAMALAKLGVKEIILIAGSAAASASARTMRQFLPKHIEVIEHLEAGSRGTAGSLKLLRNNGRLGDFFVIRGNVFVLEQDLRLLAENHSPRAKATIALGSDKEPLGLYVFSPDVLRLIGDRYMDIDTDITPILQAERSAVSVTFSGPSPVVINRIEKLMSLEKSFLAEDVWQIGKRLPATVLDAWGDSLGLNESTGRIWIGRDVQISPSAKLSGPLMIGDGSVIEGNAMVAGPTVIGRRCRIADRAVVRESTVWDEAVVEKSAEVTRSLISFGSRVGAGAVVDSGFVPSPSLDLGTLSMLQEACSTESDRTLIPVIPVSAHVRRALYHVLKRTIDVVCSLAGLIVGIPLILLIAALIKLDSPGPIFFRQCRRGKSGKGFEMIKFRTMCAGAEEMQTSLRHRNCVDGPVFKVQDDPRVTRIGLILRNTSLDEVPQLWNVLRGDMSLVGPRPLVTEELAGCPIWKALRLSVRPGITGLWQVRARYSQNFSDWIECDTAYVKNQSLGQDFRILWETARVLLPTFISQ